MDNHVDWKILGLVPNDAPPPMPFSDAMRAKARQLKDDGMPHYELAARMGIHRSHFNKVKSGRIEPTPTFVAVWCLCLREVEGLTPEARQVWMKLGAKQVGWKI